MFREDIACAEKLLIPAKLILSQENLIKKDPAERRIRLWNEVRGNYDKYLTGCCGSFLRDMDNHIHGQFNAALLILAISFKDQGDNAEAAGYFSEKELKAYKKMSGYAVFEILSPAELRNSLELRDDHMLDLLYEYSFSMDTWITSALNDNEISMGVRSYLKERWEKYRRIIAAALRQDHDFWMHSILEYSRQRRDAFLPEPGSRSIKNGKKQEAGLFSRSARAEHETPRASVPHRRIKTEALESEGTITHHDIFISYSHEDKPIADAICAALELENIRCWISPRDILPGQNYPSSIIRAIEQSRLMIIVFSSKSNTSDHVIRELSKAVSRGIIIIPFRIEDVPPSQEMEYLIGIPHWLDALTPPLERHIEKLVQTVKILLEKHL